MVFVFVFGCSYCLLTYGFVYRKVVGQFLDSDARLKGMFPVFDLKKNIYTARRIPGLDSQVRYFFDLLHCCNAKRFRSVIRSKSNSSLKKKTENRPGPWNLLSACNPLARWKSIWKRLQTIVKAALQLTYLFALFKHWISP